MSEDDIKKIKVEDQRVGIIGLKNVIAEVAEDFADKLDDKIQAELLKRLSKKNYIPDHARESYGKAFLREFNRFFGETFDDEDVSGYVGSYHEYSWTENISSGAINDKLIVRILFNGTKGQNNKNLTMGYDNSSYGSDVFITFSE